MSDTQHVKDAFWRESAAVLAEKLASTPAGLSTREAEARLTRFGPNVLAPKKGFGLLRKLAHRATEPLVLILVAAALVSGLAGDIVGLWMILGILLVSITLDVVQEYHAERAADALKQSVALACDVIRDGKLTSIPTEAVVPGDVISLSAGDLVPADGVVLSATALHANQAALTGEAYPADKDVAPAASDDMAEATNALFMGSSIVSGSGKMLVVATGAATRFGALAESMAGTEAPTAFERDMRRFGLLIVRLTGALVVFVLAVHLAFSRPAIDSVLFALALAVGLTPSLLPMIMTVSLSRGARRLAAGGVIVKKLTALHNLGSMDVLCTDKTGTLTESRIALTAHIRADGQEDEAVFTDGWLNSHFETGLKSPLDEAILAHGAPADSAEWTKLDEVPFDFERRRVSVLLARADKTRLIVKGAPEDILAHCGKVEGRDGAFLPLDAAARASLMALHDRYASDGQRLLAIATREMPAETRAATIADECDLAFVGFAVFLDPPKASAAATLDALKKAGVAVKIISGDNELVVAHVARALGLDTGDVLTGREIAALDSPALMVRVARTTLFARVDPVQKRRVILALQACGHVVGYMGDGINDAPSLKAADVGISVESAVDVAREAADLILTKPDLGLVATGAMEGRRTFANIMKYIRMGTSSNFGNMVSMAASSLFLPFLPMLPVQILFNNLLYDVSETGIPLDTVEPGELDHPQLWDMKALYRFTFAMGLLSSFFDIATFMVLFLGFKATPELFRTAWFAESMATQILVIFVIRTRMSVWRARPHPALVISSLAALTVALITPFTPLGAALGFVPIPAALGWVLVAIVTVYLVLAEGVKRWAIPAKLRPR